MMVTNLLIEEISKSGMKKVSIAERLDISATSLNNKLTGKTNFTVEEALRLLDVLGINRGKFSFYFAQKGEYR